MVRHGVHDLVGRTLCGRAAGVGLNADGLRQAEALARNLHRPDRVLTSPVERCRQTAIPIATAHDLPLEEEGALIEIDFGDWAGRDFDALRTLPEWHRWNSDRDQARPPNGEAMLEVQLRLSLWLERLSREDQGTVVAISHADAIKSVVALTLGLSLRSHDRFEVSPGSVTTVKAAPDALTLVQLNAVPHD